jgi:hypothetical protein
MKLSYVSLWKQAMTISNLLIKRIHASKRKTKR